MLVGYGYAHQLKFVFLDFLNNAVHRGSLFNTPQRILLDKPDFADRDICQAHFHCTCLRRESIALLR
jgi:hypothetical protein